MPGTPSEGGQLPPQPPGFPAPQPPESPAPPPETQALSIQAVLRLTFMAMTLVLAAAMSVTSLVAAYSSALKQSFAHMSSVAAIKESQLTSWSASLTAGLDTALPQVSASPAAEAVLTAKSADPFFAQHRAHFNSLLGRALTASGHFFELCLTDANGEVVASSSQTRIGQRCSVPRDLLEGRQGQAVLLWSHPDEHDGPMAATVRPVLNPEGKALGALIAFSDVQMVNAFMAERSGLGRTGQAYLLDQDLGLVTPAGLDTPLPLGRPVRTEGALLAKSSHQGGQGGYADASGREVVGAWRFVPALGVILLAEQDRREALEPMDDAVLTAAAIAAFMVVAAFLAAGPLATYLATPLSALALTAQRIANGELGSRAKVSGQAEVQLLAQAFNQMADRLQWRMEAENLLSRLARLMLPASRSGFDDAAQTALELLCAFFRADFMALASYNPAGKLVLECQWPASGKHSREDAATAQALKQAATHKASKGFCALQCAWPTQECGPKALWSLNIAPLDAKGAAWGAFLLAGPPTARINGQELGLLTRAGEILGMAVERSRAEAAMAQAETKYRSLFENATEAIFQTTANGRVFSANPAAARMLGFTSPEQMTSSITNLGIEHYVHQEVRREILHILASQGEVIGYEVLFKDAKGNRIWASVNAKAVPDGKGGIGHIDVRAEDISRRKSAETQRDQFVRALARKNTDLSLAKSFITDIFDSMPSFLVSLDHKGHITQLNAAAADKAALGREKALGKPFEEVFPGLTGIMDDFSRATSQGAPLERRIELTHEDALRHLDVVVYPLTARGGDGAVLRLDDVTERVRIEEMMVQSEKMLSVGGLAAGMAHEINNPLAGILHGTQVVMRRLSPDFKPNHEAAARAGCSLADILAYLERRGILEFLNNIQSSGRRAAKIVNNMLEFSRVSESAHLPTHLHEVLDQALDLAASGYDLSRKFDFRHIEIERQYAPDLPPAPCAASQIQQVVLNIVVNAAQAMADNAASGRRPRLVLRTRRLADAVSFEVEDNGPGMSEEAQRRAFEPFFTTKKVGQGTGLGLSVSYFIITQTHGGALSVRSRPGEGTTFTATLPLKR